MNAAIPDKNFQDRIPAGFGGPWYGVYVAIVSDVKDPDGQGRVKVKLPWSPDAKSSAYEAWARVAVLMAGANRGTWFIPDVNDEVLIAFQSGDPSAPFVVGCLWNGSDCAPETMDGAGKNYKKVIRSRNGVRIELNDTDGSEKLVMETPGGQQFQLKDGPGSIEITDSNGNSIKLDSSGITLQSSGTVSIKASKIDMSAGMVSVDAAMSKFSGVVKSDTCIATTVVGTTYTPGAGNIW